MDAMATISGRDNPLVAEDPIWVLAGNTNPQDVGFQQSEPVFVICSFFLSERYSPNDTHLSCTEDSPHISKDEEKYFIFNADIKKYAMLVHYQRKIKTIVVSYSSRAPNPIP